jgi:hypothetical protein
VRNLSTQLKQGKTKDALNKMRILSAACENLFKAKKLLEKSLGLFLLIAVVMHFVLILNVTVLVFYLWNDVSSRISFSLITCYALLKLLLICWSGDRVNKIVSYKKMSLAQQFLMINLGFITASRAVQTSFTRFS